MKDLNWQPKSNFKEKLNYTIDWYLENFEEYPKNRKKLIPGVW